MSECDWERLTRKFNGKSPFRIGVTWCMGWWRYWTYCRSATSLFHRQSVYRVQIVWSWMVVWPQGQDQNRQPHRTPLNPLQNPCTWWYRGIFSVLCYLLKIAWQNRKAVSIKYSPLWQWFLKMLIFQWVAISQYKGLTRLFTDNSVTLTATSKSSYFSIICNHPIYKTVQYLHRKTSEVFLAIH